MDSKGEESKISYPNIFFMIDSFEEVRVSPAASPPGRKAGGGWAGLEADGSGLLPTWPPLFPVLDEEQGCPPAGSLSSPTCKVVLICPTYPQGRRSEGRLNGRQHWKACRSAVLQEGHYSRHKL